MGPGGVLVNAHLAVYEPFFHWGDGAPLPAAFNVASYVEASAARLLVAPLEALSTVTVIRISTIPAT